MMPSIKQAIIPVADIKDAQNVLKNVVKPTPLEYNNNLSKKYGANVYLKREDEQVIRSFKIRGAYYKMSKLDAGLTANGVVCASAGNHAQGVAMACAKLEISGVIFMPTTTPKQKIDRVNLFGEGRIEIKLIGDTFDDSNETAKAYANKYNMPFIHPFDDKDVITGQGTVALEILEEATFPIDYLIVSVGGGGLISGMASYFKVLSPHTKIVAVESSGAPSLKAAIDKKEVVILESIDSFADGIATKRAGVLPLQICMESIDHHVLIPEGKMCVTLLELYNEDAIVVEPACACTISALEDLKEEIQDKNVVCVLSGGNNDITRMEEIKERALLFEGKKHYFIVRFPQRAGALKEFLELLGPDDDISRFEYTKKTNRNSGPALIGIELNNPDDFDPLIQRLQQANIDFQHLNRSPLLFEMLV